METKVSVRSDLLKIVEDLKAIAKAAEDTGESLSAATKEVANTVNDQTAVVSGGMNKIKKFGKDLAKELGNDFKALFSVNAIMGGLKINEQFAGSIKQAVTLNDTIRNLAPIFGMTEDRAERFKRNLVKGLGEIGVGSEAAANALAGLSETGVRGEQGLSMYAKTASQLAGISKEKGKEGEIAKGLSRVVIAQGGNVNDPKAMQRVADDVVRIRNATGKSATEALQTLDDLFRNANSQLKSKLAGGGAVSLATAGLLGGQGSTDFLRRYLGMDKFRRAGMEAQGLGKLIGPSGELNPAAFENTLKEAKSRGAGNAEFGLTTMGMSEDEAKGFLRLSDAMKENSDIIERSRKSIVDINDEYRKTMGLGDAFKANINKVKGTFSGLMGATHAPDLINKGTNVLSEASKSTVGSAAVIGGSAVLAAILTSKGLGGIGSALGIGNMLKTEAKAKAIEAVTGEKIQKVEVINFPDNAGGMGGMGGAMAAGSLGGPVGMGLAAASVLIPLAGTAAGKYAGNKSIEEASDFAKKQEEFRRAKLSMNNVQKSTEQKFTHDIRVTVESKDKSLKAFPKGSRGQSQ